MKLNEKMKASSILTKTTILICIFTAFSCSSPSQKETATEDQKENIEVEKSETTENSEKEIKATITHSTTKIDAQIWMDKNLNTNTFQNGDDILESINAKEWEANSEAHKPTYCYMDFDDQNGKIYGKLYNWYAINDARGLCPKGWHVPSDKEHREIRYFLGDEGGDKLKSDDPAHWKESEREFINQSGFNGLPGGAVTFEGIFVQFKKRGFWWSSTENENKSMPNTAYYLGISDNDPETAHRVYDKRLGFSVRCVKD